MLKTGELLRTDSKTETGNALDDLLDATLSVRSGGVTVGTGWQKSESWCEDVTGRKVVGEFEVMCEDPDFAKLPLEERIDRYCSESIYGPACSEMEVRRILGAVFAEVPAEVESAASEEAEEPAIVGPKKRYELPIDPVKDREVLFTKGGTLSVDMGFGRGEREQHYSFPVTVAEMKIEFGDFVDANGDDFLYFTPEDQIAFFLEEHPQYRPFSARVPELLGPLFSYSLDSANMPLADSDDLLVEEQAKVISRSQLQQFKQEFGLDDFDDREVLQMINSKREEKKLKPLAIA